MRNLASCAAAVAASLLTVQAHANLILSTGVTEHFNGGTTGTNTRNNDWSGAPADLYFGQLRATTSGIVDFYYVGNEAAYTNSLLLNGTTDAADVMHSTAGLPDVFSTQSLLGSIDVLANAFVDFGFCTSGGSDAGASDRCAWNTSSASLVEQFNFGGNHGYRSIGFRPLLENGLWGAGSDGLHAAWGLFWDDSGAANDDDHDDYVAIARFRSAPVSVPEPTTTVLLGAGLLGLAFARRARSRKA